MSRKQKVIKPVAIAVEGENFFHFLLKKIDGPTEFKNVQLWDFKQNGLEFRDWLKNFKKVRGFDSLQALGIIHDAEKNSSQMQQSIENALRTCRFATPSQPKEIAEGSPNVSYLIVPDGSPSGCLEHAILQAVGPELPLNCAEDFLNCIEMDNQKRNLQLREEAYALENWRAKVKVHALIASSKIPESSLGVSSAANMWNWEAPSLKVMLDFINQLAKPFR